MKSTLSKAGRGLYVKKGEIILKGEEITFFGFPPDIADTYGYTNGLPKITDYMFRQNSFVYDNKRDADIFKVKSDGCYLPNEGFGKSVGLGWAVNSSKHMKHVMRNCVIVQTKTYPLCQHILDTGYSGLRVMDYQILVATRDILGGEEIFHDYNLDGQKSRKAAAGFIGVKTGVKTRLQTGLKTGQSGLLKTRVKTGVKTTKAKD